MVICGKAPTYLSILVILFGILVQGCKSRRLPTYPVTVKVNLQDGTPIAHARVRFRSVDHKTMARGTSAENGICQMTTYEKGDGAVAGHYQVVVGNPVPPGDPDEVRPGSTIAKRFGSFSTSGIEFTVVAEGGKETNTLEIIVAPH